MLVTNFNNVKLDRCNTLPVAYTVQSAKSIQLSHTIYITLILNAVAQLEESLIAMVRGTALIHYLSGKLLSGILLYY